MALLITKKVKSFDISLCAICQVETNNSSLVGKPKPSSFDTLFTAVKRRNDDVAERLNPIILNNEFKLLKWHRECYSSYTSENNIKRCILKKQNASFELDTVLEQDATTSKTPTTRSVLQKTDLSKCIFCQQATKKKVSTLFRISEVGFAQKLLDISKLQQDHIFTRLSTCFSVSDIFAADVLYHETCKKEYFRSSTSTFDNDSQPNPIDSSIYQAFTELISEIDPKLESQCFSLTFLAVRLKEIHGMSSIVIDNRLVKKLLIEHYGEQILFSHPKDKSKPVSIFKINVSVEDIVDQVRTTKSDTVNDFINQLRQEIKDCTFNLKGFVCDEMNLKQELDGFHLPQTWETLLKKVVRSGRKMSEQTHRKIMCVFMDLFHIVNNGELTPKHVALAETVHHLTRSKHLITLLNRLGHCISYKQLTNIDTNIANANLVNSAGGNVPIPSNILKEKDLFVHGAIDNDDFCEETLDGKSTTHITAMVLYQTKKDVIEFSHRDPVPISAVSMNSDRNHSLSLPCQNVKKFIPQSKQQTNVLHALPSPEVSNKSTNSFSVDESLKYGRSDFLWNLCRFEHPFVEDSILPKNPVCPGWTPFNQAISESEQSITNVGFCTMVPAPPTNLDTVYTAMKNFVNINNQLQQDYQILSCDMAIYLIAKKIQMQSNEFSNLYLRIGSFHLAKIWLSVLGQYLNGSGVADILVESEVYGENTVQALLRGAQYNRGVRAHKLMYEALRRIQLSMFLNGMHESQQYTKHLTLIKQVQEGLMNDLDVGGCYDLLFEGSQELFEEFKKFLEARCYNNDTFQFWTQYCHMVEILLNCVRADREGLWLLHLETVQQMLPYFFAFNHINYVRGCMLYLEDMKKIPAKVETSFLQGHFSVKRRNGRFNNVATDHALEQTLIRSSKIQGGVIGISANTRAFQKWLLLYPNKSSITDMLFAFCGTIMDPTGDGEEYCHNEGETKRVLRDEFDVQHLITFMTAHDVFLQDSGGQQNLRNVINGLEATEDVCDFLLNVESKGRVLYEEFFMERIVARHKSIFSPIKRNKVHSFSSMLTDKKIPTMKSQIVPDAKDLTFVFLLAAQRSFSIENLVQHELLHYPPALATSDGYLKKPAKSLLTQEIEKDTKCAYNQIPDSPCQVHIIDGMALLNSIPTSLLKTFDTLQDYGNFILARILKILNDEQVIQVDLVFDVYNKCSIKSSERERRSRTKEPLQYTIQNVQTKMPKQWSRFFSVPDNKSQVVKVISSFLLANVTVPSRKSFIISGGFSISTISKMKTNKDVYPDVEELRCNHEEADTRVFFNAKEALKRLNSSATVIIHTPDTDIFAIGITLWENLKTFKCVALWVLSGSAEKKRYLGCHLAADAYGATLSSVITTVHAFSGCDTTSKLGTKKAALSEAKSKIHIEILQKIGKDQLNEDDFLKCEKLYLKLVKKTGHTCDDSRYQIVSSNPSCLRNISFIPATSDSLRLHVLRTWAQTYVWNNALEANIKAINLEDYGYYKESSGLILPLLMKKPALPQNLIPPCKCKQCSKTCPCTIKEMACCAYCKCYGSRCNNKFN